MPKRRAVALTVLVSLLAVAAPPLAAQEGPHFAMAAATADRNDSNHTPVFPKGTKKIYIVWMADGVLKDSVVKGVWFADKAEGVPANTQITVSQTRVPEGQSMSAFSWMVASGWPAGSYHVELSISGKAEKTVSFKVEK